MNLKENNIKGGIFVGFVVLLDFMFYIWSFRQYSPVTFFTRVMQ